jgi:hypothetical protein
MHLRQETSHIMVDTLCGFDAGVQASGLRRCFPGTQLSSIYKGIKT